MSSFINGPAAGVRLSLRRAPIVLRVVHNPNNGKWDALDHPDDVPSSIEIIYVYMLTEKPSVYHLCIRGKNRAKGGWYQDGLYELLPEQPTQEDARDKTRWDEWCESRRERLTAEFHKKCGAL